MDLADQAGALIEDKMLEAQARIRETRELAVPSDGICCECDIDIPLARLKALPSATRCIDCQGLAEIRGVRFVR